MTGMIAERIKQRRKDRQPLLYESAAAVRIRFSRTKQPHVCESAAAV